MIILINYYLIVVYSDPSTLLLTCRVTIFRYVLLSWSGEIIIYDHTPKKCYNIIIYGHTQKKCYNIML